MSTLTQTEKLLNSNCGYPMEELFFFALQHSCCQGRCLMQERSPGKKPITWSDSATKLKGLVLGPILPHKGNMETLPYVPLDPI